MCMNGVLPYHSGYNLYDVFEPKSVEVKETI